MKVKIIGENNWLKQLTGDLGPLLLAHLTVLCYRCCQEFIAVMGRGFTGHMSS